MKKVHFAFLYFSMVPAFVFAQQEGFDFEKTYNRGIYNISVEKYTEATETFDQLILQFLREEQVFLKNLYLGDGVSSKEAEVFATKSKYYQQANYFIGRIELIKKQPFDAMQHFHSSIEADSAFADGYIGLGNANLDLHRYPKAIDFFTLALQFDKGNIDAYLGRATAYELIRKYKNAMQDVEVAIRLNNNCTVCHQNLGYYKIKTGEYEVALEHLNKAHSNAPDDAYVLNNLGYALYQSGKKNEGMEKINISIKTDPNNFYAFKNRALIYLDQKKKGLACEDFNNAIRLGLEPQYHTDVKGLVENCE